MNNELSFIFHGEKCIECHGCDMACKMWRGTEPGVAWRRVLSIWRGVYPDVSCASLSLSCLHCSRPACIEACPSGAISKRDTDGIVLVDTALCTGCRACYEACPLDVPQFGADGLMQKCDMCLQYKIGSDQPFSAPPCVRSCPTGALEIDFLTPQQKLMTEAETAAVYRNRE